MPFRGSEPLLDELDLLARCRDALLRLLLKRVQHVNRVVETDCIDRAVGVTFMRRHDLKESAPSETLECFHGWVLFATLRRIESSTYVALNGPGKGLKVPL